MANPISIRSWSQIYGPMISALESQTDITDLFPGGVNTTMLAAAATSDMITEGKLLQILSVNNVDKIGGVDLKNLAADIGLQPPFIGSTEASVFVTITETAFQKIYSVVYAGANNPIAGALKVLVVDASQFPSGGTIYLGRNTPSFESASYVSVVNSFAGYWTLNLAAPLAKNHLIGEEVVLAQGGDRPVGAGQIVRVPSSSGSPEIDFSIVNSQILPDGETILANVAAICTIPGLTGQVGQNRIVEFTTPPWSTAAVTNPAASVGGVNAETDPQLRQRIKNWWAFLSRGTDTAIEYAVVGITDTDDNDTIVTAILIPATKPGQYSILYIDNGSGLIPSFAGVGSEVIFQSAVGTEKRFQVQQFPVVKAQLVSADSEPFNLQGGEAIAFIVDNQIEQHTFSATAFAIPGQAQAQEIAQQINNLFTTVEARAANGLLFASPTSDDPEFIQSTPVSSGTDANLNINFPSDQQYTLRLYQNDVLLSKNGLPATVTSLPDSQWKGLFTGDTLQIDVDGIVGSVIQLLDSDFLQYSSSSTLAQASPSDWADVINAKFIGVTATANNNGTFSITSNRGNSDQAQVVLAGGTLVTIPEVISIFNPVDLSATGLSAQYGFNRLTGQGLLVNSPPVGATVLAGDANTQGFADSAASDIFNLSPVNGLASEIVVTPDAPVTILTPAQTGTLTFTAPSANIQQIQSSLTGFFGSLQSNDWVHLFNLPRNALLRVYQVLTITHTNDTIQLWDPNPQTGSAALDNQTNLISAFRTSGRPQQVTLPSGSTVSNTAIASAINAQTQGILASVLSTGAIRIQTDRYSITGALGLPVITWSAKSALGFITGSYKSNDPQIAAVESGDLAGLPSGRLTDAVPDLSAPYDTLTVSGTPFNEPVYSNRGVLTYFGAAESSYRYPQLRNSTDQLTLRDIAPYPWVEIGEDLRATTTAGVELGESDSMVVQLDGNTTQKSFNIPMYIQATISGPSVPSTTQFDATDPAGNLLGTSAVWSGFRLDDYRVWLQAKVDVSGPANAGIRIASDKFGPNGEQIEFGFFYPLAPGQAAAVPTVNLNGSNDAIDVQIALASGAAIALGTAAGQTVYIDVTGSAPYDYKIQFSSPVTVAGITTGQTVVYPQGPEFDTANQFPLLVTGTSNLTDNTKTFTSSGSVVNISGIPNFTIAIGDLIQCAGQTVRITNVITQIQVDVSPAPSPVFAGSGGTISRIYVTGTHWENGVTNSYVLANASDVLAYSVGGQSASTLIALINSSAQTNSLITASLTPGNSGAGIIYESTEDYLNNGNQYVGLINGESFVENPNMTSPGVTLKEALMIAPIGDSVIFIPATCQNIADHLSKTYVTGLTIAAQVAVVGNGRRVQIATDTVGGTGQVYVTGGKAIGNAEYALQGSAQELSASRGLIELPASTLSQLSPGQVIEISQSSRAKKTWPVMTPGPSDTITLAVSGTTVTATLTQPFASIYSYSVTGSLNWIVRKLSANRVRYEIWSGSGTATIPDLIESDWVLVGNGSTNYAGGTPGTFSLPANQGWFQIRETDGATYFDIDNPNAVEDLIPSVNVITFAFATYNSVQVGDQFVLAAPASQNNQGTFIVTAVLSAYSVQYTNANATNMSATALGTAGVNTIGILDQGYTTYRKIIAIAPNPADPTNTAQALVSPGSYMTLLSETQGAEIALQNRLQFPVVPVNGVNGYAYWIGIKRQAQRAIDGYLAQSGVYPGYKASGTFLEAKESQIEYITLAFQIVTNQGVTLSSISNNLSSVIEGYVNALGLGQSVILSEIISLLQQAPGVYAVVPITPAPGTELIAVNSTALAKTNSALITLS